MCGIVDNGNGAGTIVSPDCSLIWLADFVMVSISTCISLGGRYE